MEESGTSPSIEHRADLHTRPRAARPMSSTKHKVSRVKATGRQTEEGVSFSAGNKEKLRMAFSFSWIKVSYCEVQRLEDILDAK